MKRKKERPRQLLPNLDAYQKHPEDRPGNTDPQACSQPYYFRTFFCLFCFCGGGGVQPRHLAKVQTKSSSAARFVNG